MSNQNVCRLCLNETNDVCPMFDDAKDATASPKLSLSERIMSFAHIKIAKGDGLPESVCVECMTQVEIAYHFKLLCEKSDSTLRKSLKSKEKSGGLLSVRKDLMETDRPDTEANSDAETEERERHAANDTESVDCWEMMNFTPEVIINEEDSRDSTADTSADFSQYKGSNGKHHEMASPAAMMDQQLYQLSQVEAILRNHGTEIKVQGSMPPERRKSTGASVPALHRLHAPKTSLSLQATAMLANGARENGAEGYVPMYGVEAILSNGEVATNGRSSRRSRDGEKLFKCRLCPKSYSFSSALSRHKAVHNKSLRPHICAICNKGFAEPEKLERHNRTHIIDRQYRCEHCGRVFKALNTYERHINTICSYRNSKENSMLYGKFVSS
ncbi:transcription factor Ouib [Nilaparvata lugens]|uniref:transcription factor Ouib n=1 Tax=Nilaparvata lugens TaxID=108931 RepID=UPI000B97FFC8|nr:transcription factor Ouib [Nilaparvata lugens]